MDRLPRFLPSLRVACVIASFSVPVAVHAQDAAAPAAPAPAAPTTTPAAAAPAAAAPVAPAAPVLNKEILQQAEDFWHYASVGRYPLAKAEADKIIANTAANPLEILQAFEAVVDNRNRFVDPSRRLELQERLVTWQNVPELRESCAKLLGIFNKAHEALAGDPNFIEQNIRRLGGTTRGYTLAVEQLKQSGELAVPLMLTYLRNPAQPMHVKVRIRNAMHDMGYRVLNPLLAATETQDWDLLPWVVGSLGDLGYDAAVPYLVRVLKSSQTPAKVKPAVVEALAQLRVADPQSLDTAQLYYALGEKFYYDRASVTVPKSSPAGFIWFWTETGLQKKDVPAAVFNEHMALRACEYALKLDPKRADALSLWLAAAYKREVEFPEGGVDHVWDEKHPNTHFYAVDAGTRHLSPVLARALNDNNPAVALKAIKSLQEIVGDGNLFTGDENKPVIDALHYPDRQVRFEAAFTVAAALPQKAFAGQQNVVPILAEALTQTGKPGILVMGVSQDDLNRRLESINKAGTYIAKGGAGADAAVAASGALPGVDVIVMDEKSPEQIDRMFALARGNVRLARAVKLIVAASNVASPYATVALNDRSVAVTSATDDAGLAAAIEDARKRAGSLPIDEKLATSFALRSAELLGRLAISRGQVLDLVIAQPALLAALDDARPEVAKAAAAALAPLGTRRAQAALLAKGLDEKTADDMKIVAFKNLAINAKFFRSQLETAQVDSLMKFVEAAQNPDIRAAAAESLGALNAPTDQARMLILHQAKN